jgi:methylglutaconyl-CoA hydratase
MNIELTVRSNGVATINLNRPGKGNAFHATSLDEFEDVLFQIDQNPHIRLVVLTGSGKHFCTGADLNWMQKFCQSDRETNLKQAKRLEQLFRHLYEMRPPLIASIQGCVFGGGLGLIACCDIVVAHPETRFCFSELRLGLIPAVISPYVTLKMGYSKARFHMLSAREFSPQDAQRDGLIHLIADKPEIELDSLIHDMLKTAPQASAQCRKLLRTLPGMNLEQASKLTSSLIARARCAAEGQEGVLALFNKTNPPWSP